MNATINTSKVRRFSMAAMSLGVLAACGGGGSGYSSSPASGAPPAPVSYSGTFVDASVQGLAYSATPSGLSGLTDASGTFRFQANDKITFTLNGGTGGNVTLGSFSPTTPASANTPVSVLSLAHGYAIAQVLQSLDHSAVTGTMNVGNLTLSASNVNSLSTFVASSGSSPPAGSTDVQFMSALQTDAATSDKTLKFVNSGGVTVSTAISAATAALSTISGGSAPALATVLPGKLVFHQGIVTGTFGGTTPSTKLDLGIAYFSPTSNAVAAISSNTNNTINQGTSTYSVSGSQFKITGGSFVDTITVNYLDGSQGFWTDVATDGSTGAGTYVFLGSLAPADIAGKTLTLQGGVGQCGSAAFQLVIAADGKSFSANCQGAAAGSKGSGTIDAVANNVPNLVHFRDASGTDHYVGLATGSVAAGAGTLAIVDSCPAPCSGTNPTSQGLIGFIAK